MTYNQNIISESPKEVPASKEEIIRLLLVIVQDNDEIREKYFDQVRSLLTDKYINKKSSALRKVITDEEQHGKNTT